MISPETIFFSKDTKIGNNVTIEPYVVISSKVKIGSNVIIKSFSHLEGCKIENKVEVGPYARGWLAIAMLKTLSLFISRS